MDWSGITIHHSASPDVSANEIDQWHKSRGWRGIGYHFVLRQNGDIEPGRPIDKQGAHARGRNGSHIGICLTGNLNEQLPHMEQLSSLLSLLSGLQSRYKISKDNIEGHHENCPGRFFPFDLIKSNLKE